MSEPLATYECPNSCPKPRPAWWSAPAGATEPPCSNCDAPLREVPVVRQRDVRLTEDESNGLHSALNAAQHFKVLSDSRVDALRARVDAGFVDGPSWEQVWPLWGALCHIRQCPQGTIDGEGIDALNAALDAFEAPEEWTEPDEDPEPSDDQIYNGHGMEGGIPYSSPAAGEADA